MEHIQHKLHERNTTALHVAVKRNNTQVVCDLLASGANIEAVDDRGFTPLHCAVECILPNIVKRLIERGANISAKSDDNRTPKELIPSFFHPNFVGEHGTIFEIIHEASENCVADPRDKKARYVKDGYTPQSRVKYHLEKNALDVKDCSLDKVNNDEDSQFLCIADQMQEYQRLHGVASCSYDAAAIRLVLHEYMKENKEYCVKMYNDLKNKGYPDYETYFDSVKKNRKGDYYTQFILSKALDITIRCWHGFELEDGRTNEAYFQTLGRSAGDPERNMITIAVIDDNHFLSTRTRQEKDCVPIR